MCLRYSHKRVTQLENNRLRRGARHGLHVISHMLEVMPCDIITQMSSID